MHQRYHTFDISYNPNLHFISELENQSLKNQIQKYKLQTISLQKQLTELETEILIKDRLLDQKSKHIISVTSDNLRLKQELRTLKKQLHIKNKSILLNKKRRKKLSNRTRNRLNRTEFTNEYIDSDVSSNSNELPYLIHTMGISVSEMSECSNLSEQACRLSFPKITAQDSNPPPYTPQYTPTLLAPIAENQCDNDYSMIINNNNSNMLIRISDDNINIETDEWNECIVNVTPVHNKNNNFLHVNSSSMGAYDDDSSSESSYDTTDSYDNVSYMSDNTQLLLDMNYNKNKMEPINCSNSDYEIVSPKRTESVKSNSCNNCRHQMIYDEKSCDQIIGCDTIITSPICNILETKNVPLNLNSDNVSIVDVNSNYNNNTKFKFNEMSSE